MYIYKSKDYETYKKKILWTIFFPYILQAAESNPKKLFLDVCLKDKALRAKVLSDFNGYLQEEPSSYRCPKVQAFLRFNPQAAAYIIEKLSKNIQNFDSCILQALAESDQLLEEKIKKNFDNIKKSTQKIHYFLSDPKIDARVQEAVRNFYFKTEQKTIYPYGQYVSIKAYAKKDDTHSGTIVYILNSSNKAHISKLQVDPSCYREGIGSTLFVKALSHIESSYPKAKTVDVTFQVKPFRENLSFDELSKFYSSLGACFFDAETEWSKENMIVTLKKESR